MVRSDTSGSHRADVLEYWSIPLFGCPEPTRHRLQPIYLRTSALICGGLPLCSRPFVSIRGYYSQSRNVNELINRPLDPDALFRSRIAMPESLLLAHENAVGTALCRHGANLRPGVT